MLGPLFAREWQTLPRRPQHYLARSAYLTLLAVIGVTAWLATLGGQRSITLGDAARFGQFLFELYAYWVILPLVIFFGGTAAAGAVALEKARRTFVLLLITDLRDHEIVLGKLAGSLLQLGILWLATAPLLTLLVLLGGVAIEQVLQALVIVAAAGVAAGSAGNLVAMWREQAFQAMAFTVLGMVLYLMLTQALGSFLPTGWEWLPLWLDPLQAMAQVLGMGVEAGPLPTALGLGLGMLALAAALNGLAIWRLRAWNPSVEESRLRLEPREDNTPAVAVAPGRQRTVWANPVLWREVRTRAYGNRPILIKLLYLVAIGLIAAYAIWPVLQAPYRVPFAAAFGLVPVTILSLLLTSAQAVTAITSERDRGALDLLLATDLTPGEFLFGKLGGILFNAKEYLLSPLLLVGYYGWLGFLATPPAGHAELAGRANSQAAVCIAAGMAILAAFVIVLGLHVGLRTPNSRLATSKTLGTVFFLSAGTLICIYLILMSGRFETQWTSFILFIAVGTGGLMWVLQGDRPSDQGRALRWASGLCPIAMFYVVINVLVGRPGSVESTSPFMPTLVLAGAFGFTIAAMLVPLWSEFDVALGRTGGE